MTQLLLLVLAAAFAGNAATRDFDVVVYGGTAGGVIASIAAGREGLRTALLEPGTHVGGMVSGGLGYTDFGNKSVIGGYALEFYRRVGKHYGMTQYGNDVAWYHEPHVAEDVFRQMLREAGVSVFFNQRLREKSGVAKRGSSIVAATVENGDVFTAKVFIDSSYEGDMMAQAGVSYTFGRESTSEYGEPLAGVRDRTPLHQFLVDVAAYDDRHRLLPEISNDKLLPAGSADKMVQSYNYRLCITDVPGNAVPFHQASDSTTPAAMPCWRG